MEYDLSIGEQSYGEPMDESRSNRPEAVKATLVQRVRAHKTPIYGLSYSPDSNQLVSSSFDNEIFWWDEAHFLTTHRLKLEGGVVNHIASDRDLSVCAAGCTEQQLNCWKVVGGRVKSWRQSPKDWIVGVAVSPNCQQLAIGSNNREARVLSTSNGSTLHEFRGHKDSVTSLAWSIDSRYLATGSSDATVWVWDCRTGKKLHTFTQIRSAVTALAFSPDGRWLAVAAVDFSIRVFHLGQMRLRKTFFGHQKPIEALAFHPRSWLLGSVSRDGSLGLWNVLHGIGHGRIETSVQPLSCIAFNPNGSELVTGGLDKVLRTWRLGMP